jgi:3-methyladenine DNA glycosylase AlkD
VKIIGSKAEIKRILDDLLELNYDWLSDNCINYIHKNILRKKIRFPGLEYFSTQVFELIPAKKLISFLDRIIALDEIGSYVIAGKMLQLNLNNNLLQSQQKAKEFIQKGNVWYACDIISERVLGVMLLNYPDKALKICRHQMKAGEVWQMRSVGVATHYAVKKGLPKKYVKQQFELLLENADAKGYHATTGIGWAAKTVAKFHPEIIKAFEKELQDPKVRTWFRSKIKIGLGRAYKYASTYTA